MKKLLEFLKMWADVIFLFPILLALFIFNAVIIRYLDPTANVLDLGNGAIIIRNGLAFITVNIAAYLIWQLYFRGDVFDKYFWAKLTPYEQAKTSIILWTITLSTTYFILLRDLLF